MRIDEKSLLTNILEQVVIVEAISFLPGSSVDIGIVQEEDDFFFCHNDLSFILLQVFPQTLESDKNGN